MTVAVAVGLFAAMTGTASAHAHLEPSSPADGATVTQIPAEIELVFSETVNRNFATVVVTGPGGEEIADGKPAVNGGGGRCAFSVSCRHHLRRRAERRIGRGDHCDDRRPAGPAIIGPVSCRRREPVGPLSGPPSPRSAPRYPARPRGESPSAYCPGARSPGA
ncbi:copper resistance protein CopC [Planomonospora sp. ID67723]|uniref:copper resistance CopC family protein n=1 Tax=Planomonospora sp. ID67723 TaxID=2738134 RepID=UPI0018C3D4E6|nr:copper resistance protein CopC [Planomonospora sp. ID67723]